MWILRMKIEIGDLIGLTILIVLPWVLFKIILCITDPLFTYLYGVIVGCTIGWFVRMIVEENKD